MEEETEEEEEDYFKTRWREPRDKYGVGKKIEEEKKQKNNQVICIGLTVAVNFFCILFYTKNKLMKIFKVLHEYLFAF